MHRKFRITVDGRAYDVVVEEIADEAAAPPPAAARPAAATAAHAAPSAPVAGPGDEVAPLAGVVESIEVAVGDAIAAGAKIATIEAMKMKTEVFARSAGKVIAISGQARRSRRRRRRAADARVREPACGGFAPRSCAATGCANAGSGPSPLPKRS